MTETFSKEYNEDMEKGLDPFQMIEICYHGGSSVEFALKCADNLLVVTSGKV